jgi:hypothetical protein
LLHTVERIGSFAGLASFLGLGVFALLLFAHGRDIRRLRDWAGSAPEREAERLEQTQNIAAQRAEELRELEESRTAEHAAIADRETRRQRREEGLPEQTRGERLAERFSGARDSLSRPAIVVALIVVGLLIAGGIVYAVSNSGSSSTKNGKKGGESAKQASSSSKKKQKASPGEIEVAVLNGTEATGLAATWGEKAEGKGFVVGAVSNTNSTFENSVVMFADGAAEEAKEVAKGLQIHKVQPMTAEVSGVSNGAKVTVVVGEDNAPPEG